MRVIHEWGNDTDRLRLVFVKNGGEEVKDVYRLQRREDTRWMTWATLWTDSTSAVAELARMAEALAAARKELRIVQAELDNLRQVRVDEGDGDMPHGYAEGHYESLVEGDVEAWI